MEKVYKARYLNGKTWDLRPGCFYTISIWSENSGWFGKKVTVINAYVHTKHTSGRFFKFYSIEELLDTWELIREIRNNG